MDMDIILMDMDIINTERQYILIKVFSNMSSLLLPGVDFVSIKIQILKHKHIIFKKKRIRRGDYKVNNINQSIQSDNTF